MGYRVAIRHHAAFDSDPGADTDTDADHHATLGTSGCIDILFWRNPDEALNEGSSLGPAHHALAARPGDQQAAFAADRWLPDAAPIPGRIDLLLATDAVEATRALHDDHALHPQRGRAVCETEHFPTVDERAGRDDALDHPIPAQREHEQATITRPFAHIAHRRFNDPDAGEWIMLGMAFQRGWLPITEAALNRALNPPVHPPPPAHPVPSHTTHDTTRQPTRPHPIAAHAVAACALGRRLAAFPRDHQQPDSPSQSFDHQALGPHTHHRVLRRALRAAATNLRHDHPGLTGPNGTAARRLADAFASAVTALLDRFDDAIPDASRRRELSLRLIDHAELCVTWGGPPYLRAYLDAVAAALPHDRANPARDARLTEALIEAVAKVMLIKDEFYIAALYTATRKRRRDRRYFAAQLGPGDRLEYRRLVQPELPLLGRRFRLQWWAGDWQLQLARRLRWLRRLLPGWGRRQRAFRDFYLDLIPRLRQADLNDPQTYDLWVAVFATARGVRGHREQRYPQLAAARRHAEQYLQDLPPA